MEVKYCPYCGEKLNSEDHICSKCGNEINFVDSGALDNDNFAELKILHEGVKYGRITFIASIIFTILCFFLPVFFLNSKISNLGVYIIVQLIIYEAIIADVIAVIYSFFYNRRCKKHGYTTIGYFKAASWIGLFGVAFGITFIIALLAKAINPGLNPSVSTPNNVNMLINYLLLLK